MQVSMVMPHNLCASCSAVTFLDSNLGAVHMLCDNIPTVLHDSFTKFCVVRDLQRQYNMQHANDAAHMILVKLVVQL